MLPNSLALVKRMVCNRHLNSLQHFEQESVCSLVRPPASCRIEMFLLCTNNLIRQLRDKEESIFNSDLIQKQSYFSNK